ncbi:uncharacterized protein LOC132740414 [Ruditapes philippinarum]|uniref:uncharacterized protein LOC132740414 n=1 Tax=Ruditapes philippinarum TaxID=129788 RepID=UPI00295B8026|nr:uncharacterized protein LOC132740414 [Ruditapes philippinarum]
MIGRLKLMNADKAKGDSSSGLKGNPTEVPDTSNYSESKDKRDAMENNRTEETDPSCSSQQDSTENGNGPSQIEKSEPRIPISPSPTPTSDVGSKYLQGEQGSGMLTHPTDSQMKEKVEKSQQLIPDSKSPPKSAFMKSYTESTTKVEKLTTKVSDDGSDMKQEKGDTEIENEGEMKIPQTPENEGEMKIPQTPETEVEKKTHQTPENEGEKKTPQTPENEGEKKTPQTPENEGEKKTHQTSETCYSNDDVDDDVEDKQDFENDFNVADDYPSTENLKVQSLQREDEVLDDSGSHVSESNSVEIISEEDHEEQMRDEENISIPSFNMTSMTHIPGDNSTELKPHTELCSTPGTGDEIVHDVNNSSKMPETHNAECEEEIKHFVDGNGSVKCEEHDALQQVTETPSFSIETVGKGYLLHRQNYQPVLLPTLKEGSNVSVFKNMILIDYVPRYTITMKKGEITLSKLVVAKLEDNRSESSNTKRSEHNLSAETQEQKGDEEGLEIKKVRGTTPDMQNVLNPPQENETNPLNHQDTVTDVNTGGSSGADVKKEEAKPDVDELICKLQRMELEDAPRQQQQSLEEAVCKDDKPPIPAPRLKNKENKLGNENDSQSSPTPPTRARRNSLNQPQEKKIQESKSPTTQPMYKKVTFRVTYTLAGSPEKKATEIEKEMGQLDYMKWKFATIDLKSLCANLQSSAQNQNYAFQANDGIMQVDIGSVSENSQIGKYIDNIVDIVIKYSKNCVVKNVPFKHDIRGEDVKMAVQELSVMKDGIYYAEINNEEFHVIMICHRDIADQIVAKIRDKISKLEAGSKTHTRIIEKSPVLRKKIDKESFKELLKQRFPSIDLRMNYIKTNHKLLVTFAGPKTEVDEAIAMIEHYYPCNEISFTDVKYSSEFSNIVDVLCEFTCSLQIDKDISVDINAENKKIGICSTSLDTNTDEVTNIIKKCIKRKEIKKQVGDPDFTSDLLGEIKEKYDGKQKPYIHLTFVNEGSIMVYGLKEHLDSCFSNIEKMVHVEGKAGSTVPKSSKEQSQPSSSCVKEIIRIENPLVYECICKSKQFSSVAERNDIQVKQLNTNVKGFVIDGSKEAVDSVKNEIKEIEKSIKVHTLDCKVEANHVPNFLEHIHNFDIVVREENIQIDSISYDSKKIQWIFAQGSTVQIAKSCSLPGKKVLVRFEEESINAKQGVKISGSDIVVFFPKWKDGRAKEKINLTEMFNECLQACLDRSSHHIDIMVGKVSWKMQTFVKQLLVADLLKELLQKRMTPCLSVCFCGSDEKICDDIYKACCGYFKGGFTSMPADERRVTVTVTNGNLAETKADILVSTIDRMGDLDKGAISKSILRKAGKEGHKLKDEIRKLKCPLDSLKIYKTEAFLQDCKFIFHSWLGVYISKDKSKKNLQSFVLDCLKEAEKCNCSSIAFPALGVGNLNYPPKEVQAAMFDAVEEFNMSCTCQTSLQDVKFVLYEPQVFQDFKAEQK